MLDSVVPSLDDVPEDMCTELVEMTWSDDAWLMEAVDATMPEEDQARMVEASTDGRIMLRKARATALLSIRSGKRLLANAKAT